MDASATVGETCAYMSEEDVERFHKLAEVCRDQAAKVRHAVDQEAWLKLAEDWLELARANEQTRDNRAPTCRAASD